MCLEDFSIDMQKILRELIRRNTISSSSFSDKMLIYYLRTNKFDEDYISIIDKNFYKSYDS